MGFYEERIKAYKEVDMLIRKVPEGIDFERLIREVITKFAVPEKSIRNYLKDLIVNREIEIEDGMIKKIGRMGKIKSIEEIREDLAAKEVEKNEK